MEIYNANCACANRWIVPLNSGHLDLKRYSSTSLFMCTTADYLKCTGLNRIAHAVLTNTAAHWDGLIVHLGQFGLPTGCLAGNGVDSCCLRSVGI